MNIKQLILAEYLLNTLPRLNSKANYQMVFEEGNKVFTGKMLRKDDQGDGYSTFTHGIRVEKQTYIFKRERSDSRTILLSAFKKEIEDLFSSFSEITDYPELVLDALVRTIAPIDADEYLDGELNFPPVVYDYKELGRDISLPIYRFEEKDINIISLTSSQVKVKIFKNGI